MYNYNAVAVSAKWDFSMSGTSGATEATDDSFKNFLNTSMSFSAGFEQIFGQLSEQFPSVNFKEGTPEAGAEGASKFFGNEPGDYAAIGSDVMNSIFGGNSDIMNQIKDAISSFLDASQDIQPMEGASIQRSVTITVTTVRFNVSQMQEGTGELLKADELMANLQDQMKELLEKVFGIQSPDTDLLDSADEAAASEEADETAAVTDADETAATEETDETKDIATVPAEDEKKASSWSSRNFAWSMQLFYSNTFMETLGSTNQNKQSSSFGFQASGFGSFQNFSNSILPQSIYDSVLGGDTSGQGALMAMMDKMFSGTSIGFGGLRKTDNGYLAELKETKNLLAELFESLKSRGGVPAIGGADKASETPAAEETAPAAESGSADAGAAAAEAAAAKAAEAVA
ncbi:MAG: hypothetical protein LIQ30_12330 [Planctomycetes bacterium]|nr:hypothetical protein [Planctomycetota bacterium]